MDATSVAPIEIHRIVGLFVETKGLHASCSSQSGKPLLHVQVIKDKTPAERLGFPEQALA
jgi:hypothetical protein